VRILLDGGCRLKSEHLDQISINLNYRLVELRR
jgi:hypothetical protein